MTRKLIRASISAAAMALFFTGIPLTAAHSQTCRTDSFGTTRCDNGST